MILPPQLYLSHPRLLHGEILSSLMTAQVRTAVRSFAGMLLRCRFLTTRLMRCSAGMCSVVCGDVTSLPFSDNSFDAVFCWHVLGHLPAPLWPTAASEMRRVLRSSGKIFFKGFSRNDMRCGKGREVAPYSYLRGDGIVTHYFTDTELREVFGTGELTRVSWKMRVRGTDYLREELCGVFGREGFD